MQNYKEEIAKVKKDFEDNPPKSVAEIYMKIMIPMYKLRMEEQRVMGKMLSDYIAELPVDPSKENEEYTWNLIGRK